jgi:hypothetical protein
MFPAGTTRQLQLAGNEISKSVTKNIIRNFCNQAPKITVKTERVCIFKKKRWLLVKAIFTLQMDHFYRRTVHSEIRVVHSPTNALFIKIGKV